MIIYKKITVPCYTLLHDVVVTLMINEDQYTQKINKTILELVCISCSNTAELV